MPESRFSVGNVEIIGITDIEVDFPMPLTQLFPQVPLEAWAQYQQRYPEVFPRPDTWHPHFGGFLIRSQGRTILVDTGMGSTATNPGTVAMFTGGQGLPTVCQPQFAKFLPHLHDWLTTNLACVIAGAMTQHGHQDTQQSVANTA
jgi:hypothetical protein